MLPSDWEDEMKTIPGWRDSWVKKALPHPPATGPRSPHYHTSEAHHGIQTTNHDPTPNSSHRQKRTPSLRAGPSALAASRNICAPTISIPHLYIYILKNLCIKPFSSTVLKMVFGNNFFKQLLLKKFVLYLYKYIYCWLKIKCKKSYTFENKV